MANGFESVLDPWPTPALKADALFATTIPEIPWDDRYALGLQYQPIDLADLTTDDVKSDPCATEEDLGSARNFPSVVTQTGFMLLDQVTCNALWKRPEELRANIEQRWPLLISEAFAREFLAGAAGSDHNLTTDGIGAATPSTVLGGIAELEELMALGLGNTQGYIHMTPSAFTYAVTNGTVDDDDVEGIYQSPSGHIVVADAGYQVSETTTTVMYGTGLVRWAMSPRTPRSTTPSDYMDQVTRKNILLWVEQAYGIILFDPATVYKVTATRA